MSSILPGSILLLTPDIRSHLMYNNFDMSLVFNIGSLPLNRQIVKFSVVTAASGNGLVHIRSCANNKFWVRRSRIGTEIVAAADKPEEDQSEWSCTLFRPVVVNSETVQFQYFNRQDYACYFGAERAKVVLSSEPSGTRDFRFKNWDELVFLPQQVAFKGDNDKYLKAFTNGRTDHFQFSVDDPSDEFVGTTITYSSDGLMRLNNNHWNRYWSTRQQDDWVVAESAGSIGSATWFTPVKVGSNAIALRPSGGNRFCQRYSSNLLAANASSISTPQAQMVVEEMVHSRAVVNVSFRLLDAWFYDREFLTLANAEGYNGTSHPNELELTLRYRDTRSSTWASGVSLSIAVQTTIQSGVPFVFSGGLQITTTFTGSYEWGKTEEFSSEVESRYKAIVPPFTRISVALLSSRARADVPFSYTRRDLLFDGTRRETIQDDGVYTGLNSYNFEFEVREVDRDGNIHTRKEPAPLLPQ